MSNNANDPKNDAIIFGLTASKNLAKKVSDLLKITLGELKISRFADQEILVTAKDSVRGKRVFLIQSTAPPVNENLMELLITIDALKRGSAGEINVVIPYFGYARQDRKASGRQPITCKLVANLLTTAGADRVTTFDLHSQQEQGFFDIPVDNLKAIDTLTTFIIASTWNYNPPKNLVIVSPDSGGIARARKLASLLNAPLAVIDKRRDRPNESKIEWILGDVKDKHAFIVDDMIDTAGTICNAAAAIRKAGALSVTLCATHAVFSPPAVERLKKQLDTGVIKEVIVTDTIELPEDKIFKGLKIHSIAKFLASVISVSINNDSITDIYNLGTKKLLKKINSAVDKTKK